MQYQAVSGGFNEYVGLDLGSIIFEPILGPDSLALWVRDNPDVEALLLLILDQAATELRTRCG